MLKHMRTTIILEDVAMEEIKNISFLEKRTISSIVNSYLIEGLRRRREIKERVQEAIPLPSFNMGSARVNIADRDALNDVMEL